MRKFNKQDLKALFAANRNKTAFDVFEAVFKHIEQIIESKGTGVIVDKLPGSWRTNWVVNHNYHGTVTLYENGLMIMYNSLLAPTEYDDYFVEQSVVNYHELGKLVPIDGLTIKSINLFEVMGARELQVVLVFNDDQNAG